MLPLYEDIMEKTQGSVDGGQNDLKFDELVALVLKDVGMVLLDIYEVYFPQEVKGNLGGMPPDAVWKANEKSIFDFLKEYDIWPSLLNKSTSFQIYHNTKIEDEPVYEPTAVAIVNSLVLNQGTSKKRALHNVNSGDHMKKLGSHYTFPKFLDTLVKLAKMTFSGFSTGNQQQLQVDNNGNSLMEAEMVCLLLERLELSRGFNNLEKKTNRPHTSKITLLPSKHVIQHLTAAKKSVLGPNE